MGDSVETIQPTSPAMTFGRRVGIAAAVYLAARMVSHMLQFVSAAIVAYRLVPSVGSGLHLALSYVMGAAVIAGAWLVLRRAQRSVAAGERHWLASVSERHLITALVVLLLLSRVVPRVSWDSTLFDDAYARPNGILYLLMILIGSALSVAAGYVWVWWCDRPPRVERLLLVSALAWLGFESLLEVFDLLAPNLNLLVTRTPEEGLALALPGSDAFVRVYGSSWVWRNGWENAMSLLVHWFLRLVLPTFGAGAVALGLYRVFDRSARSAPPH